MWELDCEEDWAPKNWCFWTVVLEKTLEGPLDCKEIQPVHSKGDQSWVFFGRTDAGAGTLILQPPHAQSWLIGKDSDAGRDWGQEEKGTTEDDMVWWHHRLDGLQELVMDREACRAWFMGLRRVGHDWMTELNWTNVVMGTSLVVQWLRIYLPILGMWVLSLSRKLRFHIPLGNSPCTTTTEL